MAHVGPPPTEIFAGQTPPYSRKSWVEAYFWVYFNVAFKEYTPELRAKIGKEYDSLLTMLDNKEFVGNIFDYAFRHKLIDTK